MLNSLAKGDFGTATVFAVRISLDTLAFHFGLKLRDSIGRLPDRAHEGEKEGDDQHHKGGNLNDFLLESLFKGGITTIMSVLFILFRSVKCMIEYKMSSCNANALCATLISLYLLLWWVLKLVQGSIDAEHRKDLCFSMEKVARMDISLRRATYLGGVPTG